MSTESEITVAQKAAMFDLIEIFETAPDPDKTYTAEEIKTIIRAYITGKEK